MVVLFDECEEFFRARPDNLRIEARTVGAFITAGMLPRLQRLRDGGWVVFVINSNIEAYELDDAVTRRGRLDRAARVGHPVLEAQVRYLAEWQRDGVRLQPKHLSWFSDLLAEVERDAKPVRDALDAKIRGIQQTHPLRGNEYRRLLRSANEEAATKMTNVVTFSSLDSLAMRCLAIGPGTSITNKKALAANLRQELGRFGPDRFPSITD